MRGFATVLAYVVGLSAVIGVGITGLMALQSSTNPTPSAASVVAASQKERLAKPITQSPVAQKDAQPSQKHKATHIARKRNEEAPTFSSGSNAYGYAEQPRRFYQYPSFFFGR
jgi:hypothetical protein